MAELIVYTQLSALPPDLLKKSSSHLSASNPEFGGTNSSGNSNILRIPQTQRDVSGTSDRY